MYRAVASNIIKYFHYEKERLYVLVDEAYVEIAQEIKELHGNAELRVLQSSGPEQVKKLLDVPRSAIVLLLAEPETYVTCKLFQYLDFSKGEPQLPGTTSRVLIFSVDSICRMFSGGISKNITEKERLLAEMKPNQKYRVTTVQGTDLVFEARSWIPLDFEICTAPIEDSANGVIVVDGALFFKKIEDTVSFVIKDGKIQSITANSENGKALVAEYKRMTDRTMKDAVNQQLAEIGIGFCDGAVIGDCFMEAEAAVNTCHFCFGNNVCYGGENESEFHGASVLIKNPVFTRID